MDNKISKASSVRRLKNGSYGIVLTAVVIAVVVLLNLFVSTLPTTYTHFSTESVDYFSISEETKKVVSGVDTDITAYLIASKGDENARISELLSRYEAICDRLTVKTVDPEENPGFIEKYKDENLTYNSIIFESEKRSKVVLYSDIYSTEYTEEEMYYMMYGYQVSGTTTFMGEQEITSAIDYVSSDNLPVIYTLTGHGELELDETYLGFIEEDNFTVSELNLLSSERVPEDCAILFISVPESDITSEELEKIESYRDAGGDVVLLTAIGGYGEEKYPNLVSLTLSAGMKGDSGIVVENSSSMYYGSPYVLLPDVVESAAGPASLMDTGVNVLINIAHGIMQSGDSDITVNSIINTSSSAVLMDVTDSGQLEEREDYTSGEPIMVGAYSELETENGISTFVWYSSSSLIDSNIVNSGIPGTKQLFMSTLNSLVEKEASISIIGQDMTIEALMLSEAAGNTWMIVMTVCVPLVILGTGFAVWFRRRRK